MEILLALLALSLSLAAHSDTNWLTPTDALALLNPDPARSFLNQPARDENKPDYEVNEAATKSAENVSPIWRNIDVDHTSRLELYSSLLAGHFIKLNDSVEYGVHFSNRGAGLKIRYKF
jgi:hypothetical protein